jgi:RimJ/RimL family protein N-acetyltransferase
VIVRRATIDDAAELARVHHRSFETAYGRTRDLAQLEELWWGVFDLDHVSPFAAVDGDQIVGVLSAGPARDGSGEGELYVIYVDPDHWGSSAGQLLIDQAHDVLSAQFGEAVLTVLADNPRARRFYERNGWVLEELVVEPHFGGQPTEVARYRKGFVR